MNKTIMISNVSNDKLLNGEMNENGLKFQSSIANFQKKNLYDRIIGILEVDSTNTAIKDNLTNKFNFNVYIRRNGKEIKSTQLQLAKQNEQYTERTIDTVFPFSEIKKINTFNWNKDVSFNYINSIKENFVSSSEFYPNSLFSIEKTSKNSTLKSSEGSLFTKIPKFYYRTFFYSENSNHFRAYEVISESVYNTLSSSEKTGFDIPSAFYSALQTITLSPTNNTTQSNTLTFNFLPLVIDKTNDLKIRKFFLSQLSIPQVITFNNVYAEQQWGTQFSINGFDPSDYPDITSISANENGVITITLTTNVSTSSASLKLTTNPDSENKEFFCEEKQSLYISSTPVSRNFCSLPINSKNNIFNFDNITLLNNNGQSVDDFFKNNTLDIESYYGILCYLFRLYTGSFDLCDIFTDNTEQYEITKKLFNNSTLKNNGNTCSTINFEINSSNITNEKIFFDDFNTLKLKTTNISYCTDCYITSSSHISDVDVSTYINHCITPHTYASFKTCYFDLSALPNGTFFVTNIFMLNKQNKSELINNVSFVITKTGSTISMRTSVATNDTISFFVQVGKLYCSSKINDPDTTGYIYNKEFVFYFFKIENNCLNLERAFLSKTIELLITKLNYANEIQEACIIDAYIDDIIENTNSDGLLISNINNINIMPLNGYTDIDYPPTNTINCTGACLNKGLCRDYLTNLFSNNDPNELNTNKLIVSVYPHPWSHIKSSLENNKYNPFALMEKNKQIGNKFNILNFSDLFQEPAFNYNKNLDFNLNESKLINDVPIDQSTTTNLPSDGETGVSNCIFSLPLTNTNFYLSSLTLSIKESSSDPTSSSTINLSNILIKNIYNNGWQILQNDEIQTSITLYITINSIEFDMLLEINNDTLTLTAATLSGDAIYSFEGLSVAYKESNIVFDGNIQSCLQQQGTNVSGLTKEEYDGSDVIMAHLKNKKQHYQENIVISNWLTTQNANISKFYCDNITQETHTEINNITYYKPEYSYLEIPISTTTDSETFITQETTAMFSKRTTQAIYQNTDILNATIGSLFNVPKSLTNNEGTYSISPSLYSLIFYPTNYPSFSNTDNYQFGMMNFDFLDESAYNNENIRNIMLKYTNNVFVTYLV